MKIFTLGLLLFSGALYCSHTDNTDWSVPGGWAGCPVQSKTKNQTKEIPAYQSWAWSDPMQTEKQKERLEYYAYTCSRNSGYLQTQEQHKKLDTPFFWIAEQEKAAQSFEERRRAKFIHQNQLQHEPLYGNTLQKSTFPQVQSVDLVNVSTSRNQNNNQENFSMTTVLARVNNVMKEIVD